MAVVRGKLCRGEYVNYVPDGEVLNCSLWRLNILLLFNLGW